MTQQLNLGIIASIQRMIQDMQHLVDHPRMQQRNWVAKGKNWLPILQDIVEALQQDVKRNHKTTIAALQRMIQDMQYLVDHPRMEQRNWVAKGKNWLPILQDIVGDSQQNKEHNNTPNEYQQLINWLEQLGLQIIKRDANYWAYRWQDNAWKGTFKTQLEALQAGLRERLVR